MSHEMSQHPKSVGPYQNFEVLGETRDGWAYRAHREGVADPVLLRLITRIAPARFPTVMREIEAWMQVADPGVLPVLDCGQQGDALYYCQPAIEGRLLGQLRPRLERPGPRGPSSVALQDVTTFISVKRGGSWTSGLTTTLILPSLHVAQSGPRGGTAGRLTEELQQLLCRIQQLCLSLDALHAHGLFQGPLLPNGVLVTGGRAVIVDLGIGLLAQLGSVEGRGGVVAAHPLGAHPPSVEALLGLRGHIPYLAPELICLGRGGPRTDVYSVGYLLYALLAGTAPLFGDPASVLRAIVRSHIPSLSDHVQGVPDALLALVLSMLARKPCARPMGALGVAMSLQAIGVDGVEVPPLSAPHRLVERELQGRDSEVDWVLRSWSDLPPGGVGVAVVHGGPGSGKTRLLEWIARRGVKRDLRVISLSPWSEGRGPDAEAEPLCLFKPLLRWIAAYMEEVGPIRVRAQLGCCGPTLAALEPALAVLGGGPEVLEPGFGRDNAGLVRMQTFLTRALDQLSGQAGCMLLIDDVDHADALSVGLLTHLLRRGEREGASLWVLASSSGGELGDALRALPEVISVELRPLGTDALKRIAADLHTGLDPSEVSAWVETCAGAPGLLVEALLAARSARQERAAPPQAPVQPGGVTARRARVFCAWASSLPAMQSRALALLALGGPARTLPAPFEEPEGRRAVAALLASGSVEEDSDGLLKLCHSWAAGALLESLSSAALGELRESWSAHLQAKSTLTLGEQLQLAHHQRALGRSEAAAACYLTAAHRWAAAYGWAAAARCFEAVMALRAEPSPGPLHVQLATETLWQLGRVDEAEAALRAAYLGAPEPGTRVKAGVRLAELLVEQGDVQQALSVAFACMQMEPSSSQARLCSARAALAAGLSEVAAEVLEGALRDLNWQGPLDEPMVRSQLGELYLTQGRSREALALQQVAAQQLDENRAPRLFAQVRMREVAALAAMRNQVDAVRVLSETASLFRRFGDTLSEARCHLLQGAHLARSRPEGAVALLGKAERGFAEHGDTLGHIEAVSVRAQIYWEADRLGIALEGFDEAARLSESVAPALALQMSLWQARLLRVQGDLAGASAKLSRARRAAGAQGAGAAACAGEAVCLRLAKQGDPTQEIAALRALTAALGAEPAPAQAERAEEALRALSRGQALCAGEAPHSLPERICRRLNASVDGG